MKKTQIGQGLQTHRRVNILTRNRHTNKHKDRHTYGGLLQRGKNPDIAPKQASSGSAVCKHLEKLNLHRQTHKKTDTDTLT